ncbi:hypothetical protein DWF00_11015 [Bosea caraganae]|uniref:Cysteine rich repeat protein n=1 Tax=Bosea caraganae TaxID=2763117 RepID=A0A370LCD5_9HYPH|nr:cysteine rich repeat-containing protein [Bosea caraganae]RDJ27475.1 hypothetical protein DWF00_11015 [Bosea caraganae]RDJ29490.1 hypothetical protein DWE98_02785 [Bosea caraganae]
MKRILTLAFIAASALQPAFAQDSAALRRACQADAARLCAGVMPGGGRIANCFKEKRDQLSDGCRTALQQASAQRKAD